MGALEFLFEFVERVLQLVLCAGALTVSAGLRHGAGDIGNGFGRARDHRLAGAVEEKRQRRLDEWSADESLVSTRRPQPLSVLLVRVLRTGGWS